ncbi:MAG TPA: hypothetical protein VH720_09315 [Candidatus Limnocylindrales bacterium]
MVRAVALAVGATVTLSLAAAQLTRPAGGAPAPSAPAAGVAASPSTDRRSPSPSTPPTTPPAYQAFGTPGPQGTVTIQVGSSYRSLDLASGTMIPAGTASWPSRLLVTRSGSSVCLCIDEKIEGGDASATARADGVRLGTYAARPDRGWWSVQAGSPIVLAGSLSPDGHWIAIGSARLHGLAWHFGLDVYEVGTGRSVARNDLGTVNAGNGRGAFGNVFAWGPAPSFSADGRTLVVQGTVVKGDRIAETRVWTVQRVGDRLSRPVRVDAERRSLLADPCLDIVVDPMNGGGLAGWCWFDDGRGQVVRIADRSGLVAHEVALAAEGTTWGWGPRMVLPDSSAVVAWDPVGRRLARVDLRTGQLDTSAAHTDSAQAFPALEALANRVAAWIAPTTHAKWILEPGLAISPEGTTVYAIGVREQSAEVEAPGVGVDVFDLASLERTSHWAIPGDATSIVVTPDGGWVIVASTEMPAGHTTITVIDPTTGETRAIIGGLAGEMVQFVTPSTRS